jgi:hypothetical protein
MFNALAWNSVHIFSISYQTKLPPVFPFVKIILKFASKSDIFSTFIFLGFDGICYDEGDPCSSHPVDERWMKWDQKRTRAPAVDESLIKWDPKRTRVPAVDERWMKWDPKKNNSASGDTHQGPKNKKSDTSAYIAFPIKSYQERDDGGP